MKLKNAKEMEIGGRLKGGTSEKYKTGNWRTTTPEWDEKRCIHCMLCVQQCPDACIPMKDGKRFETDFEFCKGCGICMQVCPVKCIKMVKEDKK